MTKQCAQLKTTIMLRNLSKSPKLQQLRQQKKLSRRGFGQLVYSIITQNAHFSTEKNQFIQGCQHTVSFCGSEASQGYGHCAIVSLRFEERINKEIDRFKSFGMKRVVPSNSQKGNLFKYWKGHYFVPGFGVLRCDGVYQCGVNIRCLQTLQVPSKMVFITHDLSIVMVFVVFGEVRFMYSKYGMIFFPMVIVMRSI